MGKTRDLHQPVRRDTTFPLCIHCASGLPVSPRTTAPLAWGREQGRSVLPKSLSTLFLFLLLLLLQLPLLDTAEIGLPDATGLADGLQETGTPSRGVHHLLWGSLDRSCRDRKDRQQPLVSANSHGKGCSDTPPASAQGCKPGPATS